MTPGTRRLLTACLFAIVIAAPLAALSPSEQAPTWPSTPTTLHSQEGDAITILIRATNHQDGVTSYSASNLPPGLSINNATGLVSGTLTASAAGQLDGAAGSRQVTITATNGAGSSPYVFTWNVSRFRNGDVFAGIGLGRYQVFDENGNFKYMLQAETQAEWEASGTDGAGTTTGCGYNRASRKMYFTSFDDDNDPHVIAINPVPATSVPATAFPRNRISTFRDSGLAKGGAATGRAVDNGPESVVFDNQGNMYVGHAGGYYNAAGMPADINENSIVAASGINYVYVDAAGNPLLSAGNTILYTQGVSRTGVLEKWPGQSWPGNPTALIQWGRDLQRFSFNGATGAMTRTNSFDTYAAWQGTDQIDLAADQRTIFYTSEWGAVHRYDIGADPPGGVRQLADYVVLPPVGLNTQVLHALRILPPGDGTAGVLVAATAALMRITSDGRVVSQYDAANVDDWFALVISPDAKSIWSASPGNRRIYKWHTASGQLRPLGPSNSVQGIETAAVLVGVDDVGNLVPPYSLSGLCVMGEFSGAQSAQEVCGNGIDDDANGAIDEICAVEVCSNASPGDDDGDGLVDSNDPDCGATNLCATSGFTSASVPGYCARHNFEGDSVSLLPAPGPADPNLREIYTVTGSPSLPPGITFNANGVGTGSPLFTTLLNTAVPSTKVYRITFAVRRETLTGELIANYQQQFDWTIENKNRPPVATSHARTIRPGAAVAVNVLAADPSGLGSAAADSDPDTEDTPTITANTNPANGTVSRSGSTFTYTANTGFVGTDSYTYTIADGHGGTATGTVTITVANAAPVGFADHEVTRPGRPVPINVLANDTDADGDAMTVISNTAPAHGTLSRTGGTFTYTPSLSFTGGDSFNYTMTDPYGATASARVTIDIINTPPIAIEDFGSTRPGQAVTISVLANDTDADAAPTPAAPDTLTILSNGSAANGTVSRTATTVTYTPNAGFVGTDFFGYTVSDGFGGSAVARVTVTSVNNAPIAVDDTATTRPGQAVSISVLANDSDPDNSPDVPPSGPDPMTITANTNPSNGSVTKSGNVFTYTSTAGFVGTDSFTYTISDGFGGTATATVRITSVNRFPVAVDDTATTRPGQPVTITVLANDTDADNDTLTVASNTNPSNGSVTKSGNVFTYTSTAGFAGSDSFTYTISDGFGGTATATVRITSVNRPPDAVDDAATILAGTPSVQVNARANDPADPDGDTVTITGFTQPVPSGAVTHNGTGLFTFTPAAGFSGVVTFTYTISDGFGGVDTGTVTVMVTNRPPIAVNDTATARGTNPVTISVMSNDGDPDNHVISVAGATAPSNGTRTINPNGTITYTANAGFEGTDSFFYTIRDGFGGESTAQVTINVGPPNRFDPCICSQAKASPGEIWPPNHKQTQVVNVTNLVDPVSGQPLAIRILGIYQDEPTNYLGDGETTIDAGGVGTSTAWVRAERTGNPNIPGNGRVYEIVFEATAPDGSSCQGSIFTGVPHDQGQGQYIIDDGIRYDSTVAGGPIVRNALRVERNLTDAEVTASGFTPKFIGRARIGGGATVTELQVGPSIAAPASSAHFNWTSGEQVVFVLKRRINETELRLLTGTQEQVVSYSVACANGECNDLILRAQSGGTGKLTLSSLNMNGIPLSETVFIDVGGEARSLRLSGLSLGTGATLSGIAKLEWTSTPPTGSALNFQIQVGKACPSEGGSGGGGGTGTPPLARPDEYATDEDTTLTTTTAAGVLANDLTFAGSLTASLVSSVSNGSLTLNANGSFVYIPAANFNGQDSFTYKVNDGTLDSQPVAVTITVRPVTDLPVAVNDSATANENTPATIAVLGNDSDPAGATLAIASTGQPANGKAAVSGTSIVYTPANSFVGTDTFTYSITGAEGTASATVTVTVLNVNEAPVAVSDSYTTAEDTPITVSAPGVKGNDSDPDAGDVFNATIVTQPQHGTVTLNANGSFTYTPAANYNGPDSFTYRLRDVGGLDSNVATVTLTITAVNDPPVAVGDSYVVTEDGALQMNAAGGVKTNDTDPDTAASGLTISLVTGVQRGTLTLNADGSFLYTPLPNVSGADSFVYRISDGTGSTTATATIAITDVPDAPQAADDAQSTNEDTAVTINVVANDTDADTTTLTVQSVTQPQSGTVTIVSNQVRYVPAADFNGQAVFTYVVSDGTSTATAKVVVTVTPVNDAPVAAADAHTTPRGTVLNVQAPGILGNDTDPDGQALTAVALTQPANGTLVLQTSGAFAYTPNASFTGTDTFTYRAGDGTAFSAAATVTITVTAANRPPVAASDSYDTNKNTALTIAAPGVLTNDSDPDEGNTITASLVSAPAANTGTLTLNANGSFTFTPADDYVGTTTFRYRARDDSNADSNEATVSIEVRNPSTSGQVCYQVSAGNSPRPRIVVAWSEVGDNIVIRATLDRTFVDNTWGANRIGWGNRAHDLHEHLVESDMLRLGLYDTENDRKLDFEMDYATNTTVNGVSTQRTFGVSGGDGRMRTGSASNVVAVMTSIDRNFNAFGYAPSAFFNNSPSTSSAYTPNTNYPSWIWDVWYEVAVKKSAFAQGFKEAKLLSYNVSTNKVSTSASPSFSTISCQ